MFDAGVVITPTGLPGERIINCAVVLSVNARVDISPYTCQPLAVGRIRYSQLDVVHQGQAWQFLLLLTRGLLLELQG